MEQAAGAPAADESELLLSEKAHRVLMGMLMAGELAPNEVVNERQIALKLGISRPPLREAVRRLEGARLLERQRGGTLVVRPLPIEEYMNLLAARRLVESEVAYLAAGRIPAAELEPLRERITDVLTLPEGVITPALTESDRDLHAMVAAACGNGALEQISADLRTRTSMFRFGRLPARRNKVCAEHLAIIDAIRDGDGPGARQAMQNHLDQVRLTILARLGGQ